MTEQLMSNNASNKHSSHHKHKHTAASDKNKGSLPEKTSEYPLTSTNMMLDMLANPDKMITEDRRVEYEDEHDHNKNDDNEKLDSYIDNHDHTNDDKDHDHDHDREHEHEHEHEHSREHYDNSHSDKNNDKSDDKQSSSNSKEKDTEKNKTVDDDEDETKWSKEKLQLKKLDMLRKLYELKQAGVPISQNYSMNSDYKTMKYEYDLQIGVRAKQNGINWMSSMTLNLVYGLEMLNEKYDPFSLKLRGWSEYMNADIKNYYDVYGELYEKYTKPGKGISPEVKFLFMFSGSALKFHLSQQIADKMPSLAQGLANDPNLQQTLREKAVAERMKRQAEENTKSLNDHAMKAHSAVARSANDLELIKETQMQNMIAEEEKLKNQHQFAQTMKNMQSSRAGQNTQIQQGNQPLLKPPPMVRAAMLQQSTPQINAYHSPVPEDVIKEQQRTEQLRLIQNTESLKLQQYQKIKEMQESSKKKDEEPTHENVQIRDNIEEILNNAVSKPLTKYKKINMDDGKSINTTGSKKSKLRVNVR